MLKIIRRIIQQAGGKSRIIIELKATEQDENILNEALSLEGWSIAELVNEDTNKYIRLYKDVDEGTVNQTLRELVGQGFSL